MTEHQDSASESNVQKTYCGFSNTVGHIEKVSESTHRGNCDNQTTSLSNHHPCRINREEIMAPVKKKIKTKKMCHVNMSSSLNQHIKQ